MMQADNPYGPTGATSMGAPSGASVRSVCVQQIDILSSAKMLGMMYVLFGLIFSAIYVVVGVALGVAVGGADAAVPIGAALLMAVMAPVMLGIGGFIGGAIAAVIYNLVAKMGGGGIRVDLGP